jgi:cytochrome c oxidase assembly factor CtaG
MKDFISKLCTAAIVKAIFAAIATLVYNTVAPEFNIPTFNFFIFYGLFWCVPPLFNGVMKDNED